MNRPQTDGLNVWKSKVVQHRKEEFEDLFEIVSAKSSNIEDYTIGDIPFVTSTELNNGVEKYIDPDDNSKIFEVPCIALTSFGFATIQIPPFVARSHGAVIILKPKKEVSLIELSFFAAEINLQKWRFSYGRWVTKKRLLKLDIQLIGDKKLPGTSDFMKDFDDKYKITQSVLF